MQNWKSYQQILLDEFNKRKSSHADYSLRQFAQEMSIAPSRLSEILREQQGLSLRWGEKIARTLDFDPLKKDLFLTLITKQSARSESARKIAEQRLRSLEQRYIDLHEDAFEALKSWYTFPILEKLQCEGLQNLQLIAEQLNLSCELVEASVSRMERLQMLQKNKDGTVEVKGNFRLQPKKSAEALKVCHQQVLEKSTKALEQLPSEQREFGINFLSMSPEEMPAAKQEIRNFLSHFGSKFSLRKPNQKVHVLAVQFYSVEADRPEKNNPTKERP